MLGLKGWVAGAGLVAALVVTMETPAALAVSRPTPTDLGGLGGDRSAATAVNDRGDVAGWSETPAGQRRAFLWRNGRMTDLGTLGGPWSEAAGINRHGEVVGTSETSDGNVRAFVWDRGAMTGLAPPSWADTILAAGINDQGTVVGTVRGDFAPTVAAVWEGGAFTTAILWRGYASQGAGVNNRGQVVGTILDETHTSLAFIWRDGEGTELEGPPHDDPWYASSRAVAVNFPGHVVGESLGRAVLWRED